MRVEPWEIDRMLAARARAEGLGNTALDNLLSRPQRVRQGLSSLIGSALGLLLLGWILRRKLK